MTQTNYRTTGRMWGRRGRDCAPGLVRPVHGMSCERTLQMTSPVAPETIAELVPSFVRGQWWMPRQSAVAGDATTVRDASTGEVLFHVSAEGLDLASVVDYGRTVGRSEEHTSELQSLRHLVCRLLLEK